MKKVKLEIAERRFMRKRILSLMLAVMMVCTSVPTDYAMATEGTTATVTTEAAFTVDANGVVTAYSDTAAKEIVIPESINGTVVKGIADKAFDGSVYPNLMSVVIAGKDVVIGTDAFGYNNGNRTDRFVIWGKRGSTAESYAATEAIDFSVMTSDIGGLTSSQTDLSCCYIGGSPIYVSTIVDTAEKTLTEAQLPQDIVWSSENSNMVAISQYSWEQNTAGQWVCTAQVRAIATSQDKKTCKIYFDTKTIHKELELTLAQPATEVNLGVEVYGSVIKEKEDGTKYSVIEKLSLPDSAFDGNNYYVDKGQYIRFTSTSNSTEDPSVVTVATNSSVLGAIQNKTLENDEVISVYPVNNAGTMGVSVLTNSGQVSRAFNLIALVPAMSVSITVDGRSASGLYSVIQGYTGKIAAVLLPSGCTDTVSWSSSNEKVVGISSDGTITTTEYGNAVVTCTVNDDRTGERKDAEGNVISESITFIVAEKFKYNQMAYINNATDREIITSLDIAAGTAHQLTVYDPSTTDANKMPNEPITWESSDTSIVTVDANGKITAKPNMNGAVKITAKSESGIMATLDVSVYVEATKITLESNSYQIPQGQKLIVPYTITPSNTGETVNWISDDSESVKVVSVEKDENVNGKYILTLEVLKVTDGFVNINGKTNASGVSAQVQVKGLTAIHAESIKMVPSQYVRTTLDEKGNTVYCVEKGTNFTITAEVTPTNSNDVLSWEYLGEEGIDVTKLLTVTATGNLATITARATGEVEIRCNASGGITGICYVKIIQSATSIEITNANNTVIEKAQVNVGDKLVLKPRLSAGSTDKVKWSLVSAELKEEVEEAVSPIVIFDGENSTDIKFIKAGTYVIRAKAESGKYADLTVVAVIQTASLDFMQKVEGKDNKIDLLEFCQGQTTTISLQNILPADTSDTVYNWEDNANLLTFKVAEDTKSAEVTAVTNGTTKIKVTSESGAIFYLNVKVLVPATSIQIGGNQESEDIVINKGGSAVTVTATLLPLTTNDALTWNTDKEGVISVVQTGVVSGATQKVLVTGLEAGEVILTAKAKSGVENKVRIIVKTLDIGECQATVQAQTYNGEELTPLPTRVMLNGKSLVHGTDYEIIGYANNINAGTATMSLKGIGNYSGTAEVTFAINPKGLDSTVTVAHQEEYVYSKENIRPALVVKAGETVLVEGTDYTVQYPETAKNIGTYRLTVTFTGNIKGTVSKNYKIVAKSAKTFTIKNSEDKVVTSLSSKSYTGDRITQTFSVYDGDTKLVENTDYTVTYADNQNAGVASITIKGKGNYDTNTSKVVKFTIKPYSLANVNIAKLSDMNYTGSKLEPNLVVRRQVNKTWRHLSKGTDYTVTYSNNVNTGKATVKITAGSNGNYTSSKSISFKILPTQVRGVIQASASTKSVKLSWTKNEGAVSGYTIYKFENDKYTYVKSTTKNYIVLSGLKAGSEYTYAVRAYKKVGNYTKYYAPTYSSFVTAMTASNTPSIRLSTSDQTIKVNWASAKGATSYYVYYSVKGSKGPYKKAGYSAGTSYTINAGFKKGKTVYVKIRAARMIAGKEYLGSYSATKKIKVK